MLVLDADDEVEKRRGDHPRAHGRVHVDKGEVVDALAEVRVAEVTVVEDRHYPFAAEEVGRSKPDYRREGRLFADVALDDLRRAGLVGRLFRNAHTGGCR